MKLLVIDTETGGLNHELFSCLEIGIVWWEDSVAVDCDSFYVYEGEDNFCVDSDAMKINRLNPERIAAEGIPPVEAVARVRAMCERMNGTKHIRLAGWNLDFDKRFLLRVHKLASKEPIFSLPPYFSHRGFDVPTLVFALAQAGKIDMKPEDVNSNNAFEYFDCNPPSDLRHTAKGDALATARLISVLIKKLEDN